MKIVVARTLMGLGFEVVSSATEFSWRFLESFANTWRGRIRRELGASGDGLNSQLLLAVLVAADLAFSELECLPTSGLTRTSTTDRVVPVVRK